MHWVNPLVLNQEMCFRGLLQCLEILLVVTTEGEVCYWHLVCGI